MNQRQQQIVGSCLDSFERGSQTTEQLRSSFDDLMEAHAGRQDLLYLQAAESALHSKVIGMNMLIDGNYADEPEVAGQWPFADDAWPYETVIDAINDGWRVISFPNMALSLDENRTYGLGFEFEFEFEFILEKWR